MINTVQEIGKLSIKGNVIDHGWFNHIKYKNGKANLNAIVILSDIVYWYKPKEILDENSGLLKGYTKKFKADKLQKGYDAFARQLGLTKRQVKDACDFLTEKKLITVEFRNIRTQEGQYLANVMFVEPVLENLKLISGMNIMLDSIPRGGTIERKTPYDEIPPCGTTGRKISYNEVPPCGTAERKTYTKNTTEITTEITTKNIIYPFEEIVDYLNLQAGTKYKYTSKKTKDLISTRFKEEFSLEDFKKVIDNKSKEWKNTDMEKYLRPETIFGPKFESYLNQKISNNTSKGSKDSNFNNFEQRTYDFESLERKLLGWDKD